MIFPYLWYGMYITWVFKFYNFDSFIKIRASNQLFSLNGNAILLVLHVERWWSFRLFPKPYKLKKKNVDAILYHLRILFNETTTHTHIGLHKYILQHLRLFSRSGRYLQLSFQFILSDTALVSTTDNFYTMFSSIPPLLPSSCSFPGDSYS